MTRQLSTSTETRYFSIIAQMQAWFTQQRIRSRWGDVSPAVVEQALEALWGTAAPSTWNVAVSALQNFSEELISTGERKIPLLPTGISLKKVPQRLPKPVPEEEISKLLTEVEDLQDRLLFEVLAGSGMRSSEVANLSFGEIDPQGIVQIVGKGDKERQTFLTDTAMEALKDWTVYGHMGLTPTLDPKLRDIEYLRYSMTYPIRGIFLNSEGKEVKYMPRPSTWVAYRVRKYSNYSPHQFRHYWVTDLLNNGGDLMAVMDAAGHESIKTTRGYKKVLNRETISLRSKHSRQQGRI